MQLIRRERGDGSIGGGANLKDALSAVMRDEAGAQDFGEFSGGMAAEDVHLPEAVLRGDETLRDDEVVERGGVDVRDAMGVALDGDWSGESGDGESPVDLRKGIAHRFAGPVTPTHECCGNQHQNERDEDGYGPDKDTAAVGGDIANFSVLHALVDRASGEQGRLRRIWIVGVHALIQSLNGGICRGVEALLSAVMLEP